jgi:pimeloyl-ACP methyl ester carboxylesterase
VLLNLAPTGSPSSSSRSRVAHQREGRSPRPYRFAAQAASRIPGASLVTIEGGGHVFMGHDGEVREAIRAFVQALA